MICSSGRELGQSAEQLGREFHEELDHPRQCDEENRRDADQFWQEDEGLFLDLGDALEDRNGEADAE